MMKRKNSRKKPPNMSELRVVLLGGNWGERSYIGNMILGKKIFIPQEHDCCLRAQTQIEGGRVVLINTPNISDNLTEIVEDCMRASDPGPHVLLLLLHPQPLEAQRLQSVVESFSEQAFHHSLLLEWSPNRDILINIKKQHPKIGDMTTKYRHTLLWNETLDRKMLMSNMNKILKENEERYLIYEPPSHHESIQKVEEFSDTLDQAVGEFMVHENNEAFLTFSGESIHLKPSLNLVLCGGSEEKKIAVARAILGQPRFPSVSEGSKCFKHQGEVCGRPVSLVHLPALNGKSEEAAMKESLQCISLCDPEGVHAFFLVLPVGPLTDDKAESKIIQDILGSQGSGITMPLFTTDSDPTHSAVVNFLEGNKDISELCKSYRETYVLNINDKQQMPTLLDKVDEMRTKCTSSSYTTNTFAQAQIGKIMQQKEVMDKQKRELEEFKKTSVTCDNADESPDCLRIALIGKTGSGKSSSGNTILGRIEFKAGAKQESVTKSCQKEKSTVDSRAVVVVDTPGLFDTNLKNEEVHQELVDCISLLSPGPHVFLLVLPIGRFTEEEMKTLQLLKEIFGKNSEKFTIVLFTRGDTLQHDGQRFEDFIADCKPFCRKLIANCGDRCHVFNNYDKNNCKQVSDLITMIDTMVKSNGGSCYTSEMFQEAEASIKKEVEKILKEKEEEMQRVTEELQRKHKEEMEDMERKLAKKTAEAKQERKNNETKLAEMKKNIDKEREERQKEKEHREEEDGKRREKENLQRKEYQNNLADLEEKIKAEKHTIDRQLEESQQEMRKQKEAWEKKQKEWWDKRAGDEEEARKKEWEKLKNLQEEYDKELAKYEKKRREDERMRKEEQEKMKKELEENQKEIEGLRKKYEEDARKQAEELNDFKLKYTKDFAALVDKHMEDMKEMKLRHGRQLQETEDRYDKEYKLLGDLSQHKEKNLKEEREDLKRKHEQEMKDLRDKYQSKCVIL